jgi:superfamily I DNA and/or RNA helicase
LDTQVGVGDPLQIPPVVSLPERLVNVVCKEFQVDPLTWAAPTASVQTLADAASRLQAEFSADVATRRVGLPLLVHRRCQDPMFGVSNRIAYDGQMVHAVDVAASGPIGSVLGASAWLNVDGQADSKWCPDEGEIVVRLLNRLAAAGVRDPDVYVITPFRIVANELHRRLERETPLFQRLGVEVDTWLQHRVGTIHTFQGKEAEAVVAVLGAPMNGQQGARRWASATPNILNVLVSRAKSRLYVVGSRAAWGELGHARTLARALPASV